MGAYQNNAKANDTKGKKRGSVSNGARLQAFASERAAGGADWGGCDASRLQAVVVAITELGGAVTFGLSRDLGAHSVTLMLDKDRTTLWFNGSADLDTELEGVRATLDTLT